MKYSEYLKKALISWKDLSSDHGAKFDSILKQERGGGYYIWKIAIIKSHLKYLNNSLPFHHVLFPLQP